MVTSPGNINFSIEIKTLTGSKRGNLAIFYLGRREKQLVMLNFKNFMLHLI